ncbi:UNVERIFIED_CONTAM: NAC domain-containing protein 83 [Sesamum calycinum]|uniref:NAC domain-containing protein 83 n=1 Tax=Sesamum calycinum TaxID=2727403 RepID=A0AAW2JWQ4_9LAMI
MDKFNFVRDGESKLPPGFRFQPTDEEIVFQYLARKTFSYPLPASVIPEINVFSFHPWELPDKRIVCSKRMPIVGIKRTLVFYKGKHPRAVRTDWFMHLYCIALSGNVAHNIQQKRSSQGSSVQIGKWVLCHVFMKKRGTKPEVDGNSRRRNYDFMITGETSDTDSSSASSSSSCDSDSSVVSEVSSDSANSETNRRP